MSSQKTTGWWSFFLLVLMCLGVVFGDIGTSPLYTEGEIFFPNEGEGLALTQENIIGANSAMLWFAFLIVGVCYCVFAFRADHHGEGGVLALYAKLKDHKGAMVSMVALLLILGTGLLMGDGAITPPISILGGLEGMAVAGEVPESVIVGLTLVILTILFAFQYKGTAVVGLSFGPIMLIWFGTIAYIGIVLIAKKPEVLMALNPYYGVKFLLSGGELHTKVHFMGAAMLALTGGEALYADLGHFSKNSVRTAFVVVFACLTCNYLGQAAFLMDGGEVVAGNVFYSSAMAVVGRDGLYPMIGLGTSAAVIASQALITGLFSLVAMAVAMRLIFKIRTYWTSQHHSGQIYQPAVNWLLFGACVAITLYFRNTKNLAAAYGLAVALLMFFTCISLMQVAVREWKWSWLKTLSVFTSFALIELAFVSANSIKFLHGGFFPLTIGGFAFVLMTTWKWGSERLGKALMEYTHRGDKTVAWLGALREKVEDLALAIHDNLPMVAELLCGKKKRVTNLMRRAIVFMSSSPITKEEDFLPATLRTFLKRYGSLPTDLMFLHINVDPFTAYLNGSTARIKVVKFGSGVTSVIVNFGRMEVRDIDVRSILRDLVNRGELQIAAERWEIETGEEEIIAGKDLLLVQRIGLKLFKFMRALATPAHRYFGLEGDPGISKTVIPVIFKRDGAHVIVPETEVTVDLPLLAEAK